MQPRRSCACTWPFGFAVISLAVLVALTHLLFTPLFPSPFDYFQQSNQSLDDDWVVDLDLSDQLPPNLNGSVTYHGAPWKPEIGRWLAGCGSSSFPVEIVEVARIVKTTVMDREFAIRIWDNADVFMDMLGNHVRWHCNWSATSQLLKIVHLGNGSPAKTRDPESTDWTKVDIDNIFSTNASKPGWCNMDPHDAYASKFKIKENCNCPYDGTSGLLCEIPTMCNCLNQCSGRGHCHGGFCQFFSWDEGACCAPKEIRNSMMLVHWGNTNTKHKNSTTAYWPDNWDSIPSERRGNHPCFDPKDLVLPAWKVPNPRAVRLKLWARPHIDRKTLFYFNGNLGPAYKHGRPENSYSMGLRQKLADEFGSTPNKEGKFGKQQTPNVIVTSLKSPTYYEEMASSLFCGVLPGDGWSGRMEDSMLNGCIPVIIQDGIFQPYENVLNYNSFAVRILEDDIPNLVSILQESQVAFV
ncbi:exostosin family protein [Rhynchospora pubera]|uniref:Exostosin family protein n=1 Tax=Rhynchospora pubera TaxID=906938 RepID=A0AAV8E9D9_9POAL|nr:exostosin family protein [Rhynchospora pubera]